MARIDGPQSSSGKVKRRNDPLTSGEKWLRNASLLLVLLLLVYLVSSYILNLEPKDKIPPAAQLPSPNALDLYTQASSLLVTELSLGAGTTARTVYLGSIRRNSDNDFIIETPSSWPKEASFLTDTRTLIMKNAAVFPIVDQALETDYRNSAIRSLDSFNSYPYDDLRRISHLLAIDGDIKCAGGDIDEGIARYLDVIQMGIDIQRGGAILIAKIGISAQSAGRAGLWSCLGDNDSSTTRQAAQRLEALISRRVPPTDILREEKWSGQAMILELFQDPGWRFPGDYGYYTYTATTTNEKLSLLCTSKRTIMRNYTDYLDMAIIQAKLPYFDRKQQIEPGDIISRSFAEEAGYFARECTRNDTMNALLLVSLALRAYRVDHGHYPNDLKIMVPKYIRDIPDDPFAAKGPLRYIRSGRSYTLYSIGPDGKDDGGHACMSRERIRINPKTGSSKYKWVTRPASIGRIRNSTPGDIVAGINLP